MYKKIRLPYKNFSGLITNAFLKGLFVKPEPNEFYLVDLNSSRDLSTYTIYFEENYYRRLISKLDNLVQNGDFNRSNASEDWMQLYFYLKKFEDVNLETEKENTKIVNHPFQDSFI